MIADPFQYRAVLRIFVFTPEMAETAFEGGFARKIIVSLADRETRPVLPRKSPIVPQGAAGTLRHNIRLPGGANENRWNRKGGAVASNLGT